MGAVPQRSVASGISGRAASGSASLVLSGATVAASPSGVIVVSPNTRKGNYTIERRLLRNRLRSRHQPVPRPRSVDGLSAPPKDDRFLQSHDEKQVWQRYCGFLDLPIGEFMDIQKGLLLDQIELVADSLLGRKLMGKKPSSVEEFCSSVPLTSYDDYAPYFDNCQEDVLAVAPAYWFSSPWKRGRLKWVPWVSRFDEVACRSMVAALILATASRRGEINVKPGEHILLNLPRGPSGPSCIASSALRRFSFCAVPSIAEGRQLSFAGRIREGFRQALAGDIDLVVCMSSILARTTDEYVRLLAHRRHHLSSLIRLHPRFWYRLLWSAVGHEPDGSVRRLLPKDRWPVKAVVTWGTDTSCYEDGIKDKWGMPVYQLYASSEAGVVAVQNWNRKSMTFLPDSVFFEFLPQSGTGSGQTLLLDQLEEGKLYEMVITSFYGMPLVRYRLGDLITVVSKEDAETGVRLPQILPAGRCDGIFDLFGIARLDQTTISQALDRLGVGCERWVCRKESEQGQPVIRLYAEMQEAEGLEGRLHRELKRIDRHYRQAVGVMRVNPLRVSFLPGGTLDRCLKESATTDGASCLSVSVSSPVPQRLPGQGGGQ